MSDISPSRENNLDRACGLAANGRIKPDEIVSTAKEFDQYLEGDDK